MIYAFETVFDTEDKLRLGRFTEGEEAKKLIKERSSNVSINLHQFDEKEEAHEFYKYYQNFKAAQ